MFTLYLLSHYTVAIIDPCSLLYLDPLYGVINDAAWK